MADIHWSVNRGIPPGARYDPIGPPDVPGFEPGRFIRYPIFLIECIYLNNI